MIRLQLSQAANAMDAQLFGDDAWFEGVSTDTRTLKYGELFCALSGPNFDGHKFCAEAERRGAAGAIISREVHTPLATVVVNDTKRALGRLAQAWREQFELPVIGVTGSNGKTTVKEMIAAILDPDADVLVTKGNLNNDIGVPLTVFHLSASHNYAVIEMGANHLGEIEWLTQIAKPQLGIITLCAPAHLEGFGSIDNVARAKGELYAGLPPSGTALINADDDYASFWGDIAAPRRIVKFGIDRNADVRACNIVNNGAGSGMRFTLVAPSGRIAVRLPFDGLHNVTNALAAAATAVALDVPLAGIKSGLERAQPVNGRLAIVPGIHGSRLIDDTYNANPTSLNAAIQVLCGESGEKWLVLGDMAELGAHAMEAHREAGINARTSGVDRLYTLGELAAHAGTAFGPGARCHNDMAELLAELGSALSDGVTLLVKGSRAMRMERVTQALARTNAAC